MSDRTPPLLLIHGTAANKSWWDHIAEPLAEDRLIVAIDLTGHGDSSHRGAYDLDTWTDEVAAVLAAVGGRPAYVVGHSLGGDLAAVAAQRGDVPIAAIAMIETARNPRAPHHPVVTPRPRAYFATEDDALARFASVPTRNASAAAVVDRLARSSVVRHEEGWTWKHDTSIPSVLQAIVPTLDDVLPSLTCPMALVRGEHGVITDDDIDALRALLPRQLDVATISGAGHHPMLDNPDELIEVLRSLMARWSLRDG